MLRKTSLYVLVLGYLATGINHFINPQFYLAIVPPYLPHPQNLVFLSGVAEMMLGLLLVPAVTRVRAAYVIAAMLVAFLPVHVFMLQQAYEVEHYRVGVGGAWIRLLLQPVLLLWVLWTVKSSKQARDISRANVR